LTKEEAAIITAVTGYLVGPPSEAHKYIEKLFDRPVFTHEFDNTRFWIELRRLAMPDFKKIVIED